MERKIGTGLGTGEQLLDICSKCGERIPWDTDRCPACGHVEGIGVQATPAQPKPRWLGWWRKR